MAFTEFRKIPRLRRDIIITEKIDGTNASVNILAEDEVDDNDKKRAIGITEDGFYVLAGSRTRYVVPDDDNHGFAKFVAANLDQLVKLGPGRHFGEWWGPGIQRGYGLAEKRFSLFNVHKWVLGPTPRPACCDVVPVLATGQFSTDLVEKAVEELRRTGSIVSPGFMRPEGVVVFHTASGIMFKVTLEKDEEPKGKNR